MSQAPQVRPARAGLIVLAAIMMVIGVGVAAGGAALLIAFGTDGKITSGAHPVSTPTAAVITDVASIHNTSQVADILGSPTVHLTASGGNASGVFVGIGRASDVDSYLAGVAVDQARDVDLDPFVLSLSRLDGVATPTPPGEQTFWVASASARGVADLTWNVRDGDYRMVLMNADGTPVVDTQLSVGLQLPGFFGLSLGFLIGGLILLIGGIAVLRLGLPRRGPAPAAGPPVASTLGQQTSDLSTNTPL